MSPRRRLLFAVLGLVVLLALGAAGLAAVGQRRTAAAQPAVRQDRPGPVLLVPGYGGGTGALRDLQRALTGQGRRAVIVSSLGDATGDLHLQAAELQAAVRAQLAGGAPSVDVVGYSAGGVVARIWAQDLGGSAVARRIVTLGSPHHGTDVAELGSMLGGSTCPVACQQLVPGSSLLAGLTEPPPPGPRWVSLWTAHDDVVTPPQSAVLRGVLDIELQSICPADPVRHSGLPTDPLTVALVLRSLAVSPLLQVPAATRCSALRASVSS